MEDYTLKLKEIHHKYDESTQQLQVSEALRKDSEAKLLASEAKLHKLEQEYSQIKLKLEELASLVKLYEERFRLSQHRAYGSSREKNKPDVNQLLLFDEIENEADLKKAEVAAEEETETEQVKSYTRRKHNSKSSNTDNLDNLPQKTVEHTLPEDQLDCPECGEKMHRIGQEVVRRELVIIPAQTYVLNHIQAVYGCRTCDRKGTESTFKKAPLPKAVIPGSNASASAIAHIIVEKYMYGVPLYRQELAFLNEGTRLSRQTMANWLVRAARDWLTPIYSMLRDRMCKEEEILHADETVVQVLKEPGRSSRSQSYMWLYKTGRDSDKQTVLYEYKETRSSAHPTAFLKNFKGYLHTDGYVGYGKLGPGVIRCGCWAHARRKFHEAIQSLSAEEKTNSLAQTGLQYCDKLFALERDFATLLPEERFIKRLELSKPVTDAFFTWAANLPALPKSQLGKALHYALEQRPLLENFYKDGRLEISNNSAERSIKPFVIGRKNWLFSCTPKGADASAVIYSIIETAKANNIKPLSYLNYIFETMPTLPSQDKYDALLPWSSELPESCRLPQNKSEQEVSADTPDKGNANTEEQ